MYCSTRPFNSKLNWWLSLHAMELSPFTFASERVCTMKASACFMLRR